MVTPKMNTAAFKVKPLARGNKAQIFQLSEGGWQLIARLHQDKLEFYPCEISLQNLQELANTAKAAAKENKS